jgi:hypothetical protein
MPSSRRTADWIMPPPTTTTNDSHAQLSPSYRATLCCSGVLSIPDVNAIPGLIDEKPGNLCPPSNPTAILPSGEDQYDRRKCINTFVATSKPGPKKPFYGSVEPEILCCHNADGSICWVKAVPSCAPCWRMVCLCVWELMVAHC